MDMQKSFEMQVLTHQWITNQNKSKGSESGDQGNRQQGSPLQKHFLLKCK